MDYLHTPVSGEAGRGFVCFGLVVVVYRVFCFRVLGAGGLVWYDKKERLKYIEFEHIPFIIHFLNNMSTKAFSCIWECLFFWLSLVFQPVPILGTPIQIITRIVYKKGFKT